MIEAITAMGSDFLHEFYLFQRVIQNPEFNIYRMDIFNNLLHRRCPNNCTGHKMDGC